jgi:hypothetical protein
MPFCNGVDTGSRFARLERGQTSGGCSIARKSYQRIAGIKFRPKFEGESSKMEKQITSGFFYRDGASIDLNRLEVSRCILQS